MARSLGDKTLSGLLWVVLEKAGYQGIRFVVGIILARLLMPADFGLIGMLMIFFALSKILVESGFSQALIRQETITDADRCTVFWFNLLISGILYTGLYFSAPYIAEFFSQPALIDLTRLMGLTLIFESMSIIQKADLTHQMDFQAIMKAHLPAGLAGGGVAVILAWKGFGVMSLGMNYVATAAVFSLLLWVANPWMPRFMFSTRSFKNLFDFGSKLLAAGLLNQGFQHIYKLVIGRYFSAATLGFYTQAYSLQDMGSRHVVDALTRVTYPALASVRSNETKLRDTYRKMIRASSFVAVPTMIGMAVLAEPLVLTLVGKKWLETVPFLQALCFAGAFYHLNSLNLNVLKVLGRSDIFLRLAVIKKINITIAIVVGINYGIWGLVYGQVICAYLAVLINSYYTAKFLDYPIWQQLIDVRGVFLVSLLMGALLFVVDLYIVSPFVSLLLGVMVGVVFYFGMHHLMETESYRDVWGMVAPRLMKMRGQASI